MEEIWKNIEGTRYKVSNTGKVMGLNGNILKPHPDKKGYFRCQLSMPIDGGFKNETRKVHRLVAQAFVPNPNNYPQVNHKNTIKTDNSVDNLEWSTNLMNSQHAYKSGLRPYPGKLNDEDVRLIRFLRKKGLPRKQLMKEFDVSIHVIKDIISKRSWTHV